MVGRDVVWASNAKLCNLPPGLVAVFVGATSGIGESTLKQFCRHAVRPRVYFVGRSQEAGDRIIFELKAIQPDAQTRFIRKDLTLLQNVDEVCDEIISEEKKVNLLFMTQGKMSLKGRDETSEGLDRKLTTNYYSRVRFIQRLLPLMEIASLQLSRVVSVLAPGEESLTSFHLNDLGLKENFSLRNAACHAITMTDFFFEELAKKYPNTSFVHAYPGGVKTGFHKEASFLIKAATDFAFKILSPFMLDIQESGERHLYAATSAAYPAKSGVHGGVELKDQSTMKGSAGEVGSGAYLIGSDGEFRAKVGVLEELRRQGAGKRIWDHTVETCEAVTNRGDGGSQYRKPDANMKDPDAKYTDLDAK